MIGQSCYILQDQSCSVVFCWISNIHLDMTNSSLLYLVLKYTWQQRGFFFGLAVRLAALHRWMTEMLKLCRRAHPLAHSVFFKTKTLY